ncbi:MAG: hypothetical protein MK538_00285 [Planctomycetes bacterium]|nr:hypothetical protein [Planctomycetota bacterium]
MRLASSVFSEDERQQINDAVIAAESKTSAEIIPVIATESGRYDRPEDMAGLTCGVVSVIVAWALFQRVDDLSGKWGEPQLALGLPLLALILIVGVAFGTILANRVGWVKSLFTPRNQMRDEVLARARQVFFDHRVHHTERTTGLLIFLSLFERQAVILADQKALGALGSEHIDTLCRQLTSDLRKIGLTAALCRVVEDAGDSFAEPLPPTDGDRNELPDALVMID